jgi:hypothetical protein
LVLISSKRDLSTFIYLVTVFLKIHFALFIYVFIYLFILLRSS